MANHSGGARLATKIATTVSNAIVATHQKLLSVKHRLAMLVFSDISDIISEEVHGTLGPVLRKIHDEYPDDGIAKDLLQFLATQHGQWQAIVGTGLSSGGILGTISTIMNNELAPIVYNSVFSNPHLIPDAATCATLAAKGLISDDLANQLIQMNGINDSYSRQIIEGARTWPDVSTALDMVRKGLLGRDNFIEYAVKNGIELPIAQQMANLVDVPLSPADAALALLRGNMNRGDAVKAAAAWGVSEADFDVLIGNTGEPPGPEQLVEAHRRGFIDTDRLVKGILQSRIRNEWVDVIEKLAYSPMTVADAVNAVVQNHIDQATGNSIAGQNGLENGAFDILVETAGEPLSRTEMEQLYNRGLVTKDQVFQALRESRLKNKYNDLAFALHSRLIGPRELADAVVYGSITHAQAVSKTMEQGYAKEDAEILVSSAVNRKLETQRMAVVRAVEVLYEDSAISREVAESIASKMGFEQTEASFIFQAAEFKRQQKLLTAGINAIRSKYVARHIVKNDASGLLDALGIPHKQRDSLLQVWQIEHDANVRQLTEAQIIKAWKDGLLNDQQAQDRLTELGFSTGDAALLIEMG